MKIALATCTELPHLDADEEPLVSALVSRGAHVEKPAWDQGDAAFSACDVTVIRSTWDYTARVEEFVAWATRIEEQTRVRLFNPSRVVKWNTHKRYLLELAREGVPIVPTHLARAGELDVRATLTARGWTSGAVVKPAVSAGSRDTVRVAGLAVDDAQELVRTLGRTNAERDIMVQPFVPGIARGELSLHFIDGTFTHAVNKVPKGDDFRSQPEFGSQVSRVDPSASARAVADAALRVTGGNLLYARVDLVPLAGVAGTRDEYGVMELELVEPSMYLRWAEDAARAFADAILARGTKGAR